MKQIKTSFFKGESQNLKERFIEALLFVKFCDFYF